MPLERSQEELRALRASIRTISISGVSDPGYNGFGSTWDSALAGESGNARGNVTVSLVITEWDEALGTTAHGPAQSLRSITTVRLLRQYLISNHQ